MNKKPVDLTIVIVSFNVSTCLERCLASLWICLRGVSAQIIVIDNASTDDSVQMVQRKFPKVELVANSQNLGFAAANNQGLMRAVGRYWLLLNPDTEFPLDSNALQAMMGFLDMNPRIGVCGPSLFYGDGKRQHSAFLFPSLAQIYIDLFPVNWRLRESKLNGRFPFAKYDAGMPFAIDHPLGAALMVRSEVARAVGLLDNDYFIYAEEVDWCMRIKRAGWEIWCVPAAKIIHHEAQSTRQFRERMFVELWKARFTLFRKQYPVWWNKAAHLLVKAGMKRAVRETNAARKRGEITPAEMETRVRAYEMVISLGQAR